MKQFGVRLFDPTYRSRVFGLTAGILLFLIPILGWNPLLLLWAVHLCFSYRETSSRPIRIFYCALVLLLAALILRNLIVGFYAFSIM